jgi:hypothetical protein
MKIGADQSPERGIRRFKGEPSPKEFARYFYFDDIDQELISILKPS